MSLRTLVEAALTAIGTDVKAINTTIAAQPKIYPPSATAPSSPVVNSIWIDTST